MERSPEKELILMTLMNAPAYDVSKAKRMQYALIAAGVLVAVLVVATLAGFISGHGWLFSNVYTEHRVNKFLTAIEKQRLCHGVRHLSERQRLAEASGEVQRVSTLQRFTEDWTKYSPVGPIHSHHVDKSVSDGSGSFGTTLLVASTINGDSREAAVHRGAAGRWNVHVSCAAYLRVLKGLIERSAQGAKVQREGR